MRRKGPTPHLALLLVLRPHPDVPRQPAPRRAGSSPLPRCCPPPHPLLPLLPGHPIGCLHRCPHLTHAKSGYCCWTEHWMWCSDLIPCSRLAGPGRSRWCGGFGGEDGGDTRFSWGNGHCGSGRWSRSWHLRCPSRP